MHTDVLFIACIITPHWTIRYNEIGSRVYNLEIPGVRKCTLKSNDNLNRQWVFVFVPLRFSEAAGTVEEAKSYLRFGMPWLADQFWSLDKSIDHLFAAKETIVSALASTYADVDASIIVWTNARTRVLSSNPYRAMGVVWTWKRFSKCARVGRYEHYSHFKRTTVSHALQFAVVIKI